MIVNHYWLTALVLLTGIGTASAQQPGLMPVPQQPVIMYEKPAEQVSAPQAVGCASCSQTVCVSEPKKNTKTVYTSRCKEYCVGNCSLFSLFGSSDCGCCDNCEKKVKRVLVKKTVPDCDTMHCVLKEVGAPAK